MDINDFSRHFAAKMDEIKAFAASDDIKTILGVEAVNHFKESFRNEGFTDETVNPWQDVKRRDPASPWYGHSGQTGKFSQARTKAKILTGETRELQNAFRYVPITNGVRVMNEKPYAAVHQFGKMAKIYGKKEFQMPARPFVGRSVLLVGKINEKIKREFIRILKTN